MSIELTGGNRKESNNNQYQNLEGDDAKAEMSPDRLNHINLLNANNLFLYLDLKY